MLGEHRWRKKVNPLLHGNFPNQNDFHETFSLAYILLCISTAREEETLNSFHLLEVIKLKAHDDQTSHFRVALYAFGHCHHCVIPASQNTSDRQIWCKHQLKGQLSEFMNKSTNIIPPAFRMVISKYPKPDRTSSDLTHQ